MEKTPTGSINNFHTRHTQFREFIFFSMFVDVHVFKYLMKFGKVAARVTVGLWPNRLAVKLEVANAAEESMEAGL